jgi:hypothetical protein
MSADKLRLFHEEIMQEEGIKVSDLPIEIQKKIRGFNLQMGKLERNPEDEVLFRQLSKNTVRLGDEIQDFIENDYEDEDDKKEDEDSDLEDKKPSSNDKKPASNDKKPASNSSDEKSSKENTEKSVRTEKEKPLTNGSFGNSMMEKKIMSIMESRGDNRIKISDLESIIGKEPDYPEQKVNRIKLRKVFLSNDYRLM